MANRVELEALRFERVIRNWPVDSSPHDSAADRFPLATHTTAIEFQGEHLFGKGLSNVNVSYFEYHVDMTQWRLITKRLMTKNNPWPWNV
ncbi:uncharacterized protein FMAN_09935 [Fusarium mangiferae]|uniref:Uncharacterized protein n=1 Tax=Fusarium mangiferae TaxID=192010 RepID=A0A1L7TPD4_FUSMA|nr:uncharacterized protein FMAN_09935 [Fusarium mangiferae]CVL00518.1 uncharacterized protein FMAN_09935 [Fusarium mangiferae]